MAKAVAKELNQKSENELVVFAADYTGCMIERGLKKALSKATRARLSAAGVPLPK